jgi:DNA-binding transcriptional MocR family regulator
LRWEREAALVESARQEGALVYPVSQFFLPGSQGGDGQGCAGLVLGYALLETASIELGIERLGVALRKVK